MHVDDYRGCSANIEHMEKAVNERLIHADDSTPYWPTILAAGMIARSILVLARVLLHASGIDART
jgi:hypothetical protein